MLIEGVGSDWQDWIETYAYHYAKETCVPQVVWYCRGVDCYGRTPLPEWNLKHRSRPTLEIVKVVQP